MYWDSNFINVQLRICVTLHLLQKKSLHYVLPRWGSCSMIKKHLWMLLLHIIVHFIRRYCMAWAGTSTLMIPSFFQQCSCHGHKHSFQDARYNLYCADLTFLVHYTLVKMFSFLMLADCSFGGFFFFFWTFSSNRSPFLPMFFSYLLFTSRHHVVFVCVHNIIIYI